MTMGIIEKAYRLSNLMVEEIKAMVSLMQANQSFSKIESDFAHDSEAQGDGMLKLGRAADWLLLASFALIPLTLGAGFVVAGMGAAVETAVSLSSAGAQIMLGSATAGTQGYKSGLDARMATNKSGIDTIDQNIKTNSDSMKHDSETQLKIGGSIALVVSREGQTASQKIKNR